MSIESDLDSYLADQFGGVKWKDVSPVLDRVCADLGVSRKEMTIKNPIFIETALALAHKQGRTVNVDLR